MLSHLFFLENPFYFENDARLNTLTVKGLWDIFLF
jgi:hypothetical protein